MAEKQLCGMTFTEIEELYSTDDAVENALESIAGKYIYTLHLSLIHI